MKYTAYVFVGKMNTLMVRAFSGLICFGLFLPLLCPGTVRAGDAVLKTPHLQPLIRKIDIRIPEMPGGTDRLEKTAREMILLKGGEAFSDRKFKKSLRILKASGLFREIDVPDPAWGEEIVLTFRLTPFPRVKDIKISGAFPLLEKEILNAMSIYTGDTFDESRLAAQEGAISDLYGKEGYISPKVSVRAEKDPEDGNYILFEEIEKGDYFRIEKVELLGNHAFSTARLKMRIKSWQSSLLFGGIRRFIQKDADADVKNLIAFYRKKKYADADVRAEVEKNREKRTALVRIHIDEGPFYDISFEGNKEFWDMTLKKDLVLFEKGNRGDLGLRRSIRNIRKRYRSAGYRDVRVYPEEAGEEGQKVPSVRKIRIRIEEGPRFITESLVFRGNEAIETEQIREQVLTRTPGIISAGVFVPEVLDEDKKAVKGLYLTEGYMETGIEEHIRWQADEKKGRKLAEISLSISEGVRTLVSEVGISGLESDWKSPSEAEAGAGESITREDILARIALKTGEPFREYMIKSDENSISEMISEKGYPHVQVKGTVKFSKDRRKASLHYAVDKGPFVKMGQIWFSGNFRTELPVLLNELEVREGEPFSLKRMLESHRNIRNIAALNSAQFNLLGLKQKAGEVDMLVSVEEKKPYYFQIGGGYDTIRDFFIHSRAGDRNLLGRNKDAWVGAEFSQIGYRGEMNITEPRFMGTRISSTLNLFGEETEEKNKNYGIRSYGVSVGFSRGFWKYFRANLQFGYEYREQYMRGENPLPPGDEDLYEPRGVLVGTPSLIYNSTDSYVRPTKGFYSSASLDISRGLDSGQDDFLKYRFELRYFYTPLRRITFALRGRYGYIDLYGSADRVSDDHLFYLGGTPDVRGFDENRLRYDSVGDPLGGRTEILGSLEARYDLGMNFELAAFYDIGNIKNYYTDRAEDDFRSSAGLGIRYITPIGPIGFMYGWKLDKEADEDSGKLHFALGYTF